MAAAGMGAWRSYRNRANRQPSVRRRVYSNQPDPVDPERAHGVRFQLAEPVADECLALFCAGPMSTAIQATCATSASGWPNADNRAWNCDGVDDHNANMQSRFNALVGGFGRPVVVASYSRRRQPDDVRR